MDSFCAVVTRCGFSLPDNAKKYADLEGWVRRDLLSQGVEAVAAYDVSRGLSLPAFAADFARKAGKKHVFVTSEQVPYIDGSDLRGILTSCRYGTLPVLARDVTCRHIAGVALSADALAAMEPSDNLEALAASLPNVRALSVQCHVVRDAEELYRFSQFAQSRLIEEHIASGVLILSSEGMLISPRARIGKNTLLLPGTMLLGETSVGCDCVVGPNSVLDDTSLGDRVVFKSSFAQQSQVGNDCTVGPFANLRPGSRLNDRVKIGDFVEVKNSSIGEKTSVAHLTYIGDSDVGEHVNFGCGTVTVNYDGTAKYRTVIGDNVFIGCNTNLVAPVTVHDNAYIAAGSTITEDVPAGALAIARERQVVKEGWVAKRMAKAKSPQP